MAEEAEERDIREELIKKVSKTAGANENEAKSAIDVVLAEIAAPKILVPLNQPDSSFL